MRFVMGDNGYVRTYTSRNKRRRRRRKSDKNAAVVIIAIIIVVVVLALMLTLKLLGGGHKKTDVTSGSDTSYSQVQATGDSQQATTEVSGQTEPVSEDEATTNASDLPVTAPSTTEITGETENGAIKITVSEDNWMLTLVNKYYTVGDDYVPESLVKLTGSDGASAGNGKMDARAAEFFEAMYAQCKEDIGIDLNTVSAYRSYDYQQGLFDKQVEREKDRGLTGEAAERKAATVVARPGTSDHNLGLGVDIGRITEDFENSKGYKWLNEHAHEYGFVLRYPKDKEDITHVIYEPWHWRFVGVENAKKMKEQGLTLEEYLGLVDAPAGLR